MAEQSERKIETWLAIVCGAGAGISMITSAPPIVGWLLLAVSCLAATLALRRHFLELLENKNEPSVKRKMIALSGMVACGFGFIGFSVAYYWPQNAAPTTASAPVNASDAAVQPVDESLPGAAFAVVFSMSDMAVKKRQYLFEYATPEGAKVAFYISKSDRFTFLATDRNGESYPMEVPLGKDGIPILHPVQLYCDVGSGSNYAFMRVFVNGRQIERRDFQFPIDMGSRQWVDGTLGANLGQSNNASFMISEFLLWTVSLNAHDLNTITQNEMAAFNITENPTNLPASPPVTPKQQ